MWAPFYAYVFLGASVLRIIYSAGIAEDGWEECPANLSVYAGCQFTVHALFRSVNRSCVFGTDYSYTIRINNKDFEDMDVNIKGVNGSESVCNISTTFSVENVDHNVKFVAARIPPKPKVSLINCTDILEIHSILPPPLAVLTQILCDRVIIKWTAPDILPGYNIEGYSVFLSHLNFTYHTNDTVLIIMYEDGLVISDYYWIEISSHYCGGLGNASLTSFVVADVPNVSEQVEYQLSELNETHVTVMLHTQVVNIGCLVSYPSKVSVIFICDDQVVVEDTINVSVSHNNSEISMKFILPINQRCNGKLRWKNQQQTEFITNVTINTENLLSCSIYSKTSGFDFECSCIDSSFYCCEVEAVDILTNESHYQRTNHTGSISNLCGDNYSVACYDLRSSILPFTTQLISVTGSTCETSVSVSPTVVSVVTLSSNLDLNIIIGASVGAGLPLLILILLLLLGLIMFCVIRNCRKQGKYGVNKKGNKSQQPSAAEAEIDTNPSPTKFEEETVFTTVIAAAPQSDDILSQYVIIPEIPVDDRTTADSKKPMI